MFKAVTTPIIYLEKETNTGETTFQILVTKSIYQKIRNLKFEPICSTLISEQ